MNIQTSIQELQTTQLLGHNLSIFGTPEYPLFVAKDIADLIEHPNPSELIKLVDEDERLTSTILRTGQN